MRWVIVAMLVGACYDAPKDAHLIDAADRDGEVGDDSFDATGVNCYGNGMAPFVTFCPKTHAPTFTIPDRLDITTPIVIDTRIQGQGQCDAVFSQVAAGSPQLCVKIAKFVSVAAQLRAIGTRPLLVIGIDGLEVTAGGEVNVSSRSTDSQSPAGENLAIASAAGVDGGGGGGGSFATQGGAGADGDGVMGSGGMTSPAVTMPMFVRGGSRGGAGGLAADPGLAAGKAGGAVYLLSGGPLVIRGIITASGEGGARGDRPGGGSGGGSGGMILLDAMSITVFSGAKIMALGGGGGGGSTASADGMPGQDALTTTMAAQGGSAPSPAGGGGSGGFGVNSPNAGIPGGIGGGGGGGGGASGHILVRPTTTVFPNSTVAPPPK